jgi:hypothetical protein
MMGGHYGVTRSILGGLSKSGVRYLYNPDLRCTTADVAIVLSLPQTVRRALQWKANGGCKAVFAGPNIAVLPSADGEVLRSPQLDRIIVPSDWVRAVYAAEAPDIRDKIVVHAVGVDEKYWSPQPDRSRRKNVLVYDKNMPALAEEVARALNGWAIPHEVVRYGAYTMRQYRRALDRAFACVALSESESQGIAWAEAWAMDVPTFVLHRERRLIEGRDLHVSTAPYLGTQTGRFWSRVDELNALLTSFDADDYAPRAWVLEHMTDVAAARSLLDIVGCAAQQDIAASALAKA